MTSAPAFRAFGSRLEDLDVDLDGPSLPHVITEVLGRCLAGPAEWSREPSRLWDLTVGQRLEALLRVAAQGLAVVRPCPNPACGRSIEIEVTVEELAELQQQALAAEVLALPLAGAEVRVRRPTGRDQLAWQEADAAGREESPAALLGRLVIGPDAQGLAAQLTPEVLDMIDEAMQEFDPLVDFSLTARCPDCGHASQWRIDLAGHALDRLRTRQQGLLADIHRLALHYHWSESAIFDLPAWRRARYLALLERERAL